MTACAGGTRRTGPKVQPVKEDDVVQRARSKQQRLLTSLVVVVVIAVLVMAARRPQAVLIVLAALVIMVVLTNRLGPTREERLAVERRFGSFYTLRQVLPIIAPTAAFILVALIAGGFVIQNPSRRYPAVDLSDFFSTSAQVIAGLIIALVVEGTLFADSDWRLNVGRANGFLVITVGLGAAVVGLIPGSPQWIYAACAVIAGASVAGALALLLGAALLTPPSPLAESTADSVG